jgi:hypothetical protein
VGRRGWAWGFVTAKDSKEILFNDVSQETADAVVALDSGHIPHLSKAAEPADVIATAARA